MERNRFEVLIEKYYIVSVMLSVLPLIMFDYIKSLSQYLLLALGVLFYFNSIINLRYNVTPISTKLKFKLLSKKVIIYNLIVLFGIPIVLSFLRQKSIGLYEIVYFMGFAVWLITQIRVQVVDVKKNN